MCHTCGFSLTRGLRMQISGQWYNKAKIVNSSKQDELWKLISCTPDDSMKVLIKVCSCGKMRNLSSTLWRQLLVLILVDYFMQIRTFRCPQVYCEGSKSSLYIEWQITMSLQELCGVCSKKQLFERQLSADTH